EDGIRHFHVTGVQTCALPIYRWLQEFVDIPWPPHELADRLTAAGVTVEGVERPGDALDGVVVGEILSLDLHPRADSLSVCQIGLDRKSVVEGQRVDLGRLGVQ